jgi:Uma2 family endonuclease
MAEPAREFAMMMTVEEFLVAELPEGKSELVRGEVRLTPPAGAPHGGATANLVFSLTAYVRQHRLGAVFGGAVGYELIQFPHTVRVPDASFVRADRLPAGGLRPGLFTFAPDLAIEVLSPSERASEIEEKLYDYITAGTALVWIADPVRRTIMTVSSDAPVRLLSEGDALDGGTVIPGFSCPVADVFAGIARDQTA